MAEEQFNKKIDYDDTDARPWRVTGFDGTPRRSIGDVASFHDKDVPHLCATVCNTALVSLCTYYLFSQDSSNAAVRYGAWPAAAAVVAWSTWQVEELGFAFFGGVLIALSRVLRNIYLFSDYEQLIWRLFTTWLVAGAGLFAMLMIAASTSFRQRLKRSRRRPVAKKHD